MVWTSEPAEAGSIYTANNLSPYRNRAVGTKKKSGPAIGRGKVWGSAPVFFFFFFLYDDTSKYACIYWGLMKTDHARAMLIDPHQYIYNKGSVISKLAKNV